MSTPVPTTPPPAVNDGGFKIKEITLKELDPRLQKQLEQHEKSIDRNPAVVIEICNNILARSPGALDARRLLRKAQRKSIPAPKGGMTKFFGSMTNVPFVLKSGSRMKSDPKSVLDEAEKLLTVNPYDTQALKMEAQAATMMGMMGTAALAYENIRDVQPENIENLLALGNALIDAGQSKEAIKCGERILELKSGDGDAQALLRRASVAVTMDKGKWDEQTSFRDKLADADKAQALEQEARMANDEETITRLINKLIDAIQKDQENINLYRDIIGYYKQIQKFEEALEYVRKARQQPLGKADPTLEKQESDLTVSVMRHKLEQLEVAVVTDPSRQAELEELKKAELLFRVQEAKGRVEKYPNDYGFRYDYGILLFETNQIDLAIRELQMARRNPKVTNRATLFLGRAYRVKGIYDLAIEALNQTKNEMPVMSDLKKEIIYELALCYRAAGNVEKAVDEYKTIYSNDIDYKDVAKIINEYYEKKTLS
jgi:tetratricopeptide (TPR) repeat protein